MKALRVYFFLGVLSVALAIVFLSLGIYGTIIGTQNAPLAGGVCFIVFLLPALLFLSYWSRESNMEKRLKMLADVLRGYRQISMEELAGKLDCSEENAEFLAAACVGRGYIRGRIDVTGKMFISEEPPEGSPPP